MIINPMLTLQMALGTNVSTSPPEVHIDYVDYNQQGQLTNPATTRLALGTTTTAVVVLASPIANPVREPLRLSLYQKDSVPQTVNLFTYDGTTGRTIIKATMQPDTELHFEKGRGWYSS